MTLRIRDTFEANPGLAELFKKKILEIAREVHFPEDLVDFESHLDRKGTYSDNLRIFYREYPRLSERSDYLKKNPIQSLTVPQIERSYRAYQINNGETPEPILPVIAVANTGETSAESTNPEPAAPSLPTLSFNFNYQIVTETPETFRAPKIELAALAPTMGEAAGSRVAGRLLSSRVKDHVNKSTDFLIVGDKNQGKSALGYSILEAHHEDTARPCFVHRPPKPQLLPSWIIPIENLDGLPQGAVCLIDEASKDFDQYSYRNSGNRSLAEKMRIARQNNQSMILIAHTSSIVNPNLVLPVDVYLLKEPTMFQRFKERPMIRQAYKQIKEPIQKNEYYWFDSQVFEKETFTKPVWFSELLSNAYSDAPTREGALVPEIVNTEIVKTNIPILREPETVRSVEPSRVLILILMLVGNIAERFDNFHAPTVSEGFDAEGMILAAIVGTVGFLSLLKGSFLLAAICLTLAFLGLIYAHPRFDRERK